jgi:hypothetical protein
MNDPPSERIFAPTWLHTTHKQGLHPEIRMNSKKGSENRVPRSHGKRTSGCIVANSEVTISSIELRVETEKVSIKERGHFPFDFCESGQASVPSQFTP